MFEDALTVVSWAIRDALVEILAGSSEDDARVVVVDAGDVERTQRIEGRSARGRERRRDGRVERRRVRRIERGRGRRVERGRSRRRRRVRTANLEALVRPRFSRLPPDLISYFDVDAVWAATVLRILNSLHR